MSMYARHSFESLIARGLLEVGDGYRASVDELGGNGPVFLRSAHVRDGGIDLDGADRFQVESEQLARKMSQSGDVVVVTKGNGIGKTAFVSDKMPALVYSPQTSYWRSKDRRLLLPGFLRYWSTSFEFHRQIRAMSGATDMAPYLSLRDQQRLTVTLPPPLVQSSIAAILGALDDKIELNRGTVETLEELTRVQFQHWSEESCLVWPEAPLGDVVTMRRGYDLPLGVRREGAVPVVSSAGVSGSHAEAKVKGPGVVTGRYGTLGEVYWSDVDFWPLNTTLYVEDFHGNDPWYVLHLLRGIDFGKYSDKAAVPGVNRNDLERELVRVAPVIEQAAFRDRSWPWKARATEFEWESRTLAELRDTLLPKLLSGALRVREAEKIVGEAT